MAYKVLDNRHFFR